MPVAEDLLGVQFDLQMLAKLALSIAGVLLVSWAYRFYNSRRWQVHQDGPGSHQPNRTAASSEPGSDTSSAGNRESELIPPSELSPRETLLVRRQNLPQESQKLLSPGETLLVLDEHKTGDPQNTSSVGERFSDHHEDSPDNQKNILSSGETFPDQYEDSAELQKNSPSPEEMLSDQPEKPNNILSPVEANSAEYENSPTALKNKSGDMFSDKSKCSSAENERESDVAIVGENGNQNCDPDLPTKEIIVQQDPPGVNFKRLAPDGSTQGTPHKNTEEAKGQMDADLVLDFSESSPAKVQEQVGVSQTTNRSQNELGRVAQNTHVSRDLKDDIGNLENSSLNQSKNIVRKESEDFLTENDRVAPVEVDEKVCHNRMKSSLSPSIPSGEVHEVATPHDLQRLSEPELSGTEVHPVNVEPDKVNARNDEDLSPVKPSMTPLIGPEDLTISSLQDNTSTATPEPSSPSRQGLVRKDSYMHIVDNTDLQIPLLNPQASTPLSQPGSQTPSSEDHQSKPPGLTNEPATHSGDASRGAGREREGVQRFNISPVTLEGKHPEPETMQERLDLGNCLHALSLARKEGDDSLQCAALKVMSDNYFQVLQDPELYGCLKGGDRDLIQKLRMRGRRCLVVADLDPQDWAGSESSPSKTSSSLYYYDDNKDAWNFLCPLPKEVVSRGSAMCVMDNYLFVTLGCEGSGRDVQLSKRVFCYNPATSIWKEISPMNEARPQCKLVALGGCVYAIGGECLSSVERYDPRTGRWTFVAPMPNDTFAVAHRATTCNGELFVSGGTLKYTLLRYNPATNTWRRSIIVGNKEKTVEMVAVKNFLYRFDAGSNTVNVYRYHVAARLWYECCSKKFPNCSAFQCAVMDDTIFCVGRQAVMRLLADEVSPAFLTGNLSTVSAAKGTLLPFVMVLPETETLQTSV